jgi:hypothetical protein
LFPHCTSLSRGPPWGAEPGFELGPAVQQADALLFELRRTLFELRRTLFELRRTLFELRRTLFFKVEWLWIISGRKIDRECFQQP